MNSTLLGSRGLSGLSGSGSLSNESLADLALCDKNRLDLALHLKITFKYLREIL